MESLERKLDRLTIEEKKEVEDFVDFLLARNGTTAAPEIYLPAIPPALQMARQPAVHDEKIPPVRPEDSVRADTPPAPAAGDEPASGSFYENDDSARDSLTRDYMDYGRFEHQSPATEAVGRVKRKIIAREGQNKSRHLLDWVD